MKENEVQKHILQFTQNFLHDTAQYHPSHEINHTEENILESKHITRHRQSKHQESVTQQPTVPKKRNRFEMRCGVFVLESVVSIGVFIGFVMLGRVLDFPYFAVWLCLGLLSMFRPVYFSMCGYWLCMMVMVVVNFYLSVSILTYFQLLIVYLSVSLLAEPHKLKLLSLVVLLLYATMVVSLYFLFTASNSLFFYLFPFILTLGSLLVRLLYSVIRVEEWMFLHLPLLELGLWYAVIMHKSIHDMEFWYMLVLFTLYIINDRTQLIVRKIRGQCGVGTGVLCGQLGGFLSLQSLYLVVFVYGLCYLQVEGWPFKVSHNLQSYMEEVWSWRRPLIIWAFHVLYEFMSYLFGYKKQYIILGYSSNEGRDVAVRMVLGVVGFGMFYAGFCFGLLLVP